MLLTDGIPFNCLTFLDPRYLDMYADTEELMQMVKNDIFNDPVYDREIISPPPAVANISNMIRIFLIAYL